MGMEEYMKGEGEDGKDIWEGKRFKIILKGLILSSLILIIPRFKGNITFK